jgi:SAM-dependent methyltransferase
LDIGGNDVFTYLLRAIGLRDITLLGHYDPERINILRKREIPFILCDNFNTDILDVKNAYDAIILFEVIEHLLDPMNLLVQLYDLCKESGNVFCSTPNMSSSYSIKRLKKFMNPYCYSFYSDKQLDIGHKREFTPLEIRQIMHYSGFNIKYLTTFQSDSDFERKDFWGLSRRILFALRGANFFEKTDLRGRTIFYIGAKGSKEQQVRHPEDFYRSFTQP